MENLDEPEYIVDALNELSNPYDDLALFALENNMIDTITFNIFEIAQNELKWTSIREFFKFTGHEKLIIRLNWEGETATKEYYQALSLNLQNLVNVYDENEFRIAMQNNNKSCFAVLCDSPLNGMMNALVAIKVSETQYEFYVCNPNEKAIYYGINLQFMDYFVNTYKVFVVISKDTSAVDFLGEWFPPNPNFVLTGRKELLNVLYTSNCILNGVPNPNNRSIFSREDEIFSSFNMLSSSASPTIGVYISRDRTSIFFPALKAEYKTNSRPQQFIELNREYLIGEGSIWCNFPAYVYRNYKSNTETIMMDYFLAIETKNEHYFWWFEAYISLCMQGVKFPTISQIAYWVCQCAHAFGYVSAVGKELFIEEESLLVKEVQHYVTPPFRNESYTADYSKSGVDLNLINMFCDRIAFKQEADIIEGFSNIPYNADQEINITTEFLDNYVSFGPYSIYSQDVETVLNWITSEGSDYRLTMLHYETRPFQSDNQKLYRILAYILWVHGYRSDYAQFEEIYHRTSLAKLTRLNFKDHSGIFSNRDVVGSRKAELTNKESLLAKNLLEFVNGLKNDNRNRFDFFCAPQFESSDVFYQCVSHIPSHHFVKKIPCYGILKAIHSYFIKGKTSLSAVSSLHVFQQTNTFIHIIRYLYTYAPEYTFSGYSMFHFHTDTVKDFNYDFDYERPVIERDLIELKEKKNNTYFERTSIPSLFEMHKDWVLGRIDKQELDARIEEFENVLQLYKIQFSGPFFALYAKQFITPQTYLGCFVGKFSTGIKVSKYRHLRPVLGDKSLRIKGLYCESSKRCLDMTLYSNELRYITPCHQPDQCNVFLVSPFDDKFYIDPERIYVLASRNIEIGEELLLDVTKIPKYLVILYDMIQPELNLSP